MMTKDMKKIDYWIHVEDYGLVTKTHWTCQKDLKFHPIARYQPYSCPKCGKGTVYSLVLCTMDNLCSSPSYSFWIYKCKSCKYQFTTEDGKHINDDYSNCGDLEWK